MTKFTKEMVEDYADKLLIGLTEEENKMVLEEFEIIDKTINVLEKIEGIEKIEPMTHPIEDFVCSMREDEIEEAIPIEDALKNCDDVLNREVRVPKVVEE